MTKSVSRGKRFCKELALALSLLAAGSLGAASAGDGIRCQGSYPYHLQGVATDGKSVFWTFTSVLVKTDLKGNVLATFDGGLGAGHQGDLCVHDGKVVVGVNRSEANGARVGDEVWVFDAADLKLLKKYPTPETVYCNNGVEWYGGYYFVIGAIPYHHEFNYVWQYTEDFRLKRVMPIRSGWTQVGVQTICYLKSRDEMAFGYYGNPKDAEMPHASGTFFVKPADLVQTKKPKGSEWVPHSEIAPVLEISGREAWDTACGLLELDGRVYKALTWSAGEGKEKRWSALLRPVTENGDNSKDAKELSHR